jgi:hypothetical protein
MFGFFLVRTRMIKKDVEPCESASRRCIATWSNVTPKVEMSGLNHGARVYDPPWQLRELQSPEQRKRPDANRSQHYR